MLERWTAVRRRVAALRFGGTFYASRDSLLTSMGSVGPLPAYLGGAQAEQQDAYDFAEENFDRLAILLLHAISQGSQTALSSNHSVQNGVHGEIRIQAWQERAICDTFSDQIGKRLETAGEEPVFKGEQTFRR